MSNPSYGPVNSFSPLGDDDTVYRSPASHSDPALHENPFYDPEHGDLGTSGIEMQEDVTHRLNPQASMNTLNSSTLFPSKAQTHMETIPYHDHLTIPELYDSDNTYVPLEDHSGRQFRAILVGSSSRWLITLALCGGYVLSTRIWQKRNAQNENEKKMYNAITTGISIALGLNIASAFKDIALNMRWPILAGRKRNLVELDLILHADSLTKLTKLVFVTKRPFVILCCIFWLLINLLAQAGIAMLSLTYNFNTDYSQVQVAHSTVSGANMTKFYPFPGDVTNIRNVNASVEDQEYTAHIYGESAYNYGVNESQYIPKAGDIYQPSGSMLWTDRGNSSVKFLFYDAPEDSAVGLLAVYTNRTIEANYVCESYKVTENGNGTSLDIVAEKLGNITLSQTVPDSMTYTTWEDSLCPNNTRCSTVTAFESSNTNPWFYICNITLGQTYNDPDNVSYISDYMAEIATGSIAQIGYTDFNGIASQIYPTGSPWGIPQGGNASEVGLVMANYALGTIAGATIYNPVTNYIGTAPIQGVILQVNHPKFFYMIIGLIVICHFVFVVVVAWLANRVMVGPEGHLSMGMLLRDVTDALAGVSGGIENAAYKGAKKRTTVIYQKNTRTNGWYLKMIDR